MNTEQPVLLTDPVKRQRLDVANQIMNLVAGWASTGNDAILGIIINKITNIRNENSEVQRT